MENKKKNAPDRAGSEAKNTIDAAVLVLSVERKREILETLDALQELLGFLR